MTTNNILALYPVGQRVELHPATDAWMRGDRYGEITHNSGVRYHVKMDRSGKSLQVTENDILRAV